jgi:hypothetical protein
MRNKSVVVKSVVLVFALLLGIAYSSEAKDGNASRSIRRRFERT